MARDPVAVLLLPPRSGGPNSRPPRPPCPLFSGLDRGVHCLAPLPRFEIRVARCPRRRHSGARPGRRRPRRRAAPPVRGQFADGDRGSARPCPGSRMVVAIASLHRVRMPGSPSDATAAPAAQVAHLYPGRPTLSARLIVVNRRSTPVRCRALRLPFGHKRQRHAENRCVLRPIERRAPTRTRDCRPQVTSRAPGVLNRSRGATVGRIAGSTGRRT